jgi:uncharacterized protein YfaS (alpha-2-macroglobulin family)
MPKPKGVFMLHLHRSLAFRGFILVIVLAILTVVFTNHHPVNGQGDGVLGWVVNTSPVRGDELPVTQGVTFTFGTPMERASVEAAFSVSPTAPGTFTWTDDTTFIFTPSKPYDRDTSYIFQIDSAAKTKEGSTLRDTFTLKLHTSGYLEVTQFFPNDDYPTGDLLPTITIVFNRPVVPIGSAEQMKTMAVPFISKPPITGQGEWLSSSLYTFKTTQALQGDTDYTITIPKTLTDVSGTTPKDDISYSFHTVTVETPEPESLSIHYVTPEDQRTGIFRRPRIRIGFDGVPDLATAEAGFTLLDPNGKPVPGKFTWKDDANELQFLPDDLLDYLTTYTIIVDPKGIHTKSGIPLTVGTKTTFTTLDKPHITGTSPDDGSVVNPATQFTVAFSAPMKLDDFPNHISISPKTPFAMLDSDIGPDSESVRIEFSTLPSTIYTITVDTKGLVDIWGTPLEVPASPNVYTVADGDKVNFRFVTSPLGPAMSLETDGQQMGLYNGYHQTRVFVTHRNINTIGMTLYNISLPLFLNGENNSYRDPDEKETLLRRWAIPVYNPLNVMRYDLLSITTNGISIGQAGNIVCIEAAPSILAVGQTVKVVRRDVPVDETATPSTPASLNIRNAPGTQNSAVVASAPNGTLFNVLDGPTCADHYVWWKVQSLDGKLSGWIAEGDLKQPYVVPDNPTPATDTSTMTPLTPTPIAQQPLAANGDLPPGIYRLEMEAPDIPDNSHHITHVMIVATENITLKVAQNSALAWVTNLKTGLPVRGVGVQFYRLMQIGNQQKVLPYSSPVVTDDNGYAELNTGMELYPGEEVLYAVVVTPGHFGIAESTWTQGIDASDFNQPNMFNNQDIALYLYTDRRLYRPGEPIYFKGTIRNRTDAVYSLNPKKAIDVDITDPFNRVIYSKKVPVNAYGSFSDSIILDANAELGEYKIVARPNKPEAPPVQPTAMMPNNLTGTPTDTPSPTIVSTPVPLQQIKADAQPYDPQFVTQITVGDYTPPEFQVAVKAESPHVAPGDTIAVDVDSSYYFGGPVTDAPVQWTIRTDPYSFYYTGPGYYSFEDYNQDAISQDYADDQPTITDSGSGKTDDQGHYVIKLPAALGKSRRAVVYTIEAIVWDKSEQMVADRTQVVIDQGLFQVGVGVDDYVGAVGDKQTAHLISVANDSSPLPNTPLDVKVVLRTWGSVQTIEPGTGRTIWENDVIEKEIASGHVVTDANGKANFDFTPPQGGAYKIYATTRDKKDNQITASTFIWIAGPDFVPWKEPNSNRIDLQADKTDYKVGDTASILIPTPFQGQSTALVTIERGTILKKEVIMLNGNSTIYKLPITPDMAPNAFISVTVIKGEDDHNFTAAFRVGLIQLNVATDQLALQVSVKSDRQQVGPRDQVTYKIHVTDYKGDPVQAEVGLALVDEAVLSLLPDDLPSLMDYFYSRQGLGVRSANSLIFSVDQKTQQIINVQKGGGKGGNDYFGVFTVRKNFITTPLWSPFVITDTNGDATVTVTLPDQLTTWVMDARAYTLPIGPTKTTLVGQATASLISTRPLLIRPQVPRFYVVGDTTLLSAIVNNNTDSPQDVATTLDIKGGTVTGDLTQYATIPARGQMSFEWPMTVQDTDAIDTTFKVITKDGKLSDAAKPVTGTGDDRLVPILRYDTPDTVTTSGVIGTNGGIRTEGVLVPPQLASATLPPNRDTLQIHIDRSLASSTTTALHALQIYPYYCMEQTVSRFLPDAVMYHAEKSLGVDDPALQKELSGTLDTALQRIYKDQHYDGGWGWFVDDSTDQYISAYTVLGMAEARGAGYPVDQTVYNNSITALQRSLKDVDDKTDWWDLNREAFILYVLARASQEDVQFDKKTTYYDISRSVKLFDQRDRMNLDAIAFLAMDFAIIEPTSGYHTQPLLDIIKKAAKYSLTGRHWEDPYVDLWNWSTDTRSTAIVLKALVQIEPSSDLIPDTVRWLMTARKFDAWETTQETAWSVMALAAWMKQTGDLTPKYTFGITINGQAMTSGEVASADNVRVPYDLTVPLGNLQNNQVNALKIQRSPGDGSLFYTAQLKTYLPVDQVKALSRGITIQRKYSLADDRTHQPITWVNIGDRIRVSLTIIVPEDLNYVAIEDPIPAGTQSIDTSLQTTPKFNFDDPVSDGWRWWVFTHIEMRDEKTVLYAPFLPAGTYEFTYQLRAGAVGTYHVMPANGHTFYMPSIFGRTDGQMFTILPQGQAVF